MAPKPSDPEERDPTAEEPESGGEIPGFNPDDEVIPVSPGFRRLRIVIGLIFVVAILGFLAIFILTTAGRSPEASSVFGAARENPPPAGILQG